MSHSNYLTDELYFAILETLKTIYPNENAKNIIHANKIRNAYEDYFKGMSKEDVLQKYGYFEGSFTASTVTRR